MTILSRSLGGKEMLDKNCSLRPWPLIAARVYVSIAVALVLLLVPNLAWADFLLTDPGDLVYYQYVGAGQDLQIDKDSSVSGNLHANGNVQIKKDVVVDGDVSATGDVQNQGMVNGTITENAPELDLPEIPSEETLRGLADRVIEDNVTFQDEVLDDVVFVAGNVEIRGSLQGEGTIITTGNVRMREDSTAPAEGTLISIIAFGNVRIDKSRPFRGALRADGNIDLEMGTAFEGVLFSNGNVHVKKDSQLTFLDFDQAPPVIELIQPVDGALLNTATPAIELAFSDDLPGVDPSSVVILLDGLDVTADAQITADGATFTPGSPLDDGLHDLDVTVGDLGGAESSASFTFATDILAPILTVINPIDGAVFTEPSIQVTGTVTDALGVVTVTVNGGPVAQDGDVFSAPFSLAPGENTITVEAVDAVDNRTIVVVTVSFVEETDTDPPNLAWISPQPGAILSVDQPVLEVTFDDDESGVDPSTLSFTVNGEALPVSCVIESRRARCTPQQSLAEAGLNLVAAVSDVAGNGTTAGLQVIVDLTGVEVFFTSPDSGLITVDDQVLVTGGVGAGVAAVSVNGEPASLMGSSFSASIQLREGINSLVALATKDNGNTGTAVLSVVRDLAVPNIRIDSPRDGLVTTADRITVTGLVADVVTGSVANVVEVNGVVAQVANGAFLAMDVPLARGANTLTAVATDAVGNTSSNSIQVLSEVRFGPRLRVVSGNGQVGVIDEPLEQPFVVEVLDALGNPLAGRLVQFEMVRNSGVLRSDPNGEAARRLQVPTSGSGQAKAYLTLGVTAGEGNNRLRATVLGLPDEIELCASARTGEPHQILLVGGGNQLGQTRNPLPMPLEALVVDRAGNPVSGVPVTFEVVEGGGTVDGEADPVVHATGIDGVARGIFTVGAEEGINNHSVRATFEGLEALPAVFVASAVVAVEGSDTRLVGVILDNAQTPIPNAEVTIHGTNLATFSDAEGRFALSGVPVGHIEVEVDPTVTPRAETFPRLAMEALTIAGQENTLGGPILLPQVNLAGAKEVGGAEDVVLTIPGVEGFSLTVFAGSTTFPDGSPTGSLSISQVHLDKVPMVPPNGSFFMPPAWTIQPSGVVFDPPARVALPNDGMAPGQQIDIFQFDHTLNQFINVGKATVSEDAFEIVSDPDFGITRAGWGGCSQPPPPVQCPEACEDDNVCNGIKVCDPRRGVCVLASPPLEPCPEPDDPCAQVRCDRKKGCVVEKGDDYDPDWWDDGSGPGPDGSRGTGTQGGNNCYNYALNHASGTFAQPGPDTPPPGEPTCASVSARAIADGLVPASCSEPCPEPGYLVALSTGPNGKGGRDFHWYRQHPGGSWSHKPDGHSVRNFDAGGSEITDPSDADMNYNPPGRDDRANYNDFCGCFCYDCSFKVN